MDLSLLVKGAIIGFVVAAPAGPIAVLCLHRTLDEGRLSGFATGLGAALADTVYGAIAAFGVGAIGSLLLADLVYFRIGGGAVVIALGIVTFFRKPRLGAVRDDHLSLLGSFASAFALTLANPITILAFLAIFAGLGMERATGSGLDGLTLIASVFAGAAAWWMLLTAGAALFRHRFTEKGLSWVTRTSGIAIAGFGVLGVLTGVVRLLPPP